MCVPMIAHWLMFVFVIVSVGKVRCNGLGTTLSESGQLGQYNDIVDDLAAVGGHLGVDGPIKDA